MSCCGKRRQSLNFFPAINQAKVPEEKSESTTINESKAISDSVFRYTGNESLEVKGMFGGKRYLFSVAQPQLSVLPEDTPMMRGFTELVEMKIKNNYQLLP